MTKGSPGSSIGLALGLQAIETLLAEHPTSGRFCHGESPTIADICLVTQVTPAKTFYLPLDAYPMVMRVYDTCMAIPAFANAHPASSPMRSRRQGLRPHPLLLVNPVNAPLRGKRVLRGHALDRRVPTRSPRSAADRRGRGAAYEALTRPGDRARSRDYYGPPPRPRSAGASVRRAGGVERHGVRLMARRAGRFSVASPSPWCK